MSTENSGTTEKPRKGRIENLRPWQKGIPSPNPGGRPKNRPITEIYDRILANAKNIQEIEAAVLKTLLGGRMAAVLVLKEMAERLEGKVTQPVDVSGELTLTISERMRKASERLERASETLPNSKRANTLANTQKNTDDTIEKRGRTDN